MITGAMKPGITFRGTEIRPAGHIFFIPGAERPGDDPKNRPHFLLNRCDPAAGPHALGTLAHMSTKATEIVEYGCAGHEIAADRPTAFAGDRSFVITARLLPRLAWDLHRSRYSAVDEVRAVRRSVMHALSVGDDATPRGRGSIRGRIVRVLDHRAGFSFGFVLTAHEYSLQRRYQIVVPIIDRVVETEGGLEELELTPWDVVPERQSWFANLPFAEPMIDTARLLSLTEEWRKSRDPRRWLHKQIEMTSGMIDETTLAQIEAKIVERLLR
jgi:hypothetical protein